jgi:hypothetical protein
MLDWFASRFVGDPVTIGAVAAVLASLWLVSRSGGLGARPVGLAWAAVAWGLWAVWEAIVVGVSPEADIRADLLLLIPAVLASTLGGLALAFWPGAGARPSPPDSTEDS